MRSAIARAGLDGARLLLLVFISMLAFGIGIGITLGITGVLASHDGMDVVHVCVNQTGAPRFVPVGQPPDCKEKEIQVDLAGGGLAANFADQQAELNALLEQNAALQTTLDALVAQVPDCLSQEADGTALFTGCNVQIVNGMNATGTTNGTGNLIVGYDENTVGAARTGSHNIVVGKDHTYSSYGGLVAGYRNTISGAYASVSGGRSNEASGDGSSVSAGFNNRATGDYSGVSGGDLNTASGGSSSISGGQLNTASGVWSSVSSGQYNVAGGDLSLVGGGRFNAASGDYSSVSGGIRNKASGQVSSVNGGESNQASGSASSVSGGRFRSASGVDDWVAGNVFQDY